MPTHGNFLFIGFMLGVLSVLAIEGSLGDRTATAPVQGPIWVPSIPPPFMFQPPNPGCTIGCGAPMIFVVPRDDGIDI